MHRFRIDHPVMQFETEDCGKGALLCELACNGDDERGSEAVSDGKSSTKDHASRFQMVLYHVLRLFLGVALIVTLRVFLVRPMAPHVYGRLKKERLRPANHQP